MPTVYACSPDGGALSIAPLRVLIVEDYDDNRFLLKYQLERKGCQVLEAADGQSALDVAQQERPDLVLMDIGLPDIDGLEVTRRLKESPATREIPVIAISAFCAEALRKQEALQSGCVDCLIKPLQWPELDRHLQSSQQP